MKTYIVYSPEGYKMGYIKAADEATALAKAIGRYGEGSSVCFTKT